ncbi:MAG: CBS domain-containing protein [Betaproteobacteria bacterium]|nr:CBS domain-containing protein [Betaproteobacteria bacterium]
MHSELPPPVALVADPLATPLSALLRRAAVTCCEDTPVRLALEMMRRENIGSILLTDAAGRPSGMFTLKDLRDRVALGACNIDQPMRRVMTPHPFSLPEDAPAFEAAMAMARRSIHHVVVTRDGQVAGVISEKDLFALQQVGVSRIASTLCLAEDLPTLRRAAEDIRRLARNLMAQGVGAEQLTRLISQLNDQLTQRILFLAFAEAGLEDVDWCWLALGSEGRFEQTLHTDQDNGLIFAAPEGMDADAVRAPLLATAQRANEWLDACGFPLCKGEIMASNPKWCLSLSEWQDTFGDWIFRGDAPVLLNASIFFDFRALAGDARLAEELRAWLNGRVKEHRMFLRQMVQNALGRRPPLGLVRDFVVDGEGAEADTIDLKLAGATLFVDAARIFALAAGADVTGTVQRLRAAGETWRLNTQEVEGWVGGFLQIQQMRLHLHQSQLEENRALGNRLDPDTLSSVERQGLKEALRQARKLQGRLESFFQF